MVRLNENHIDIVQDPTKLLKKNKFLDPKNPPKMING